MGNFTQDAFWTNVSPRKRREMADYARDALVASGVTTIPWDEKKPDLVLVVMTLVRRIEELTRAFRAGMDEKPTPTDLLDRALVTRELILSWEYVGQDLLNTIAGDMAWDQKIGTKRLGKVTDALRRPINVIKGDLGYLLDQKKKPTFETMGFTRRTMDTSLKLMKPLLPKLEEAFKPETEEKAKPKPKKAKKA